MTSLLLKLFLKGDLTDKNVRGKCGTLAGIVGVLCNLLLFIIKFLAGTLSGSVSMIADAFNNFSDMGSSIVTMLGFKLASKPADPEHPFGHGRMEYMSAALVSVLIMLVGFELLTESASKLKNPTVPDAGLLPIIILAVSILIKLWMAVFNRSLGKKINSGALAATATDSLNDCISTAAVLAVAIVCRLFPDVGFVKYLDPIVGIIVAVFILYSGYLSIKETLDPLIGLAPDPKTVDEIKNIVMADPDFLGIHDMMVHNYGPNRGFVSLHVEVSATGDILVLHEKIDRCERDIKHQTGIEAVIHMDPIVTDDEDVNRARNLMSQRIAEFYNGMTIHDFRMVKGEQQNNLIFDVCVPSDCKLSHKQIRSAIQGLATDIDKTYQCVITVDHDFSGGKH